MSDLGPQRQPASVQQVESQAKQAAREIALPIREQPLTQYRVVITGDRPTTAKIIYTDCRLTAEWHDDLPGHKAECYIYGIGWESISKVKP